VACPAPRALPCPGRPRLFQAALGGWPVQRALPCLALQDCSAPSGPWAGRWWWRRAKDTWCAWRWATARCGRPGTSRWAPRCAPARPPCRARAAARPKCVRKVSPRWRGAAAWLAQSLLSMCQGQEHAPARCTRQCARPTGLCPLGSRAREAGSAAAGPNGPPAPRAGGLPERGAAGRRRARGRAARRRHLGPLLAPAAPAGPGACDAQGGARRRRHPAQVGPRATGGLVAGVPLRRRRSTQATVALGGSVALRTVSHYVYRGRRLRWHV